MERWLPVQGYDSYEISDRGRIWSANKKRLLRPYVDKDGYLKICLYVKGKRRAFRMHRLVATAFIPNPDEFEEVHHRDKCRDNNHVKNLEWRAAHHGTIYENVLVYDKKSDKLLYRCHTYKEAEHFTGIAVELIKAEIESGGFVDNEKYRFVEW